MRHNFLFYFFILLGISLQGQNIICGPDSVRLELNGFQYGNIQWEESLDSVDWAIIPEAIDSIYETYIDEPKFIRAEITYPYCPPEYSDVFTINMPIEANAGMDRRTPINEIRLHGNKLPGSNGSWTILNGSGGSISNPDSAWSMFTGTTGNTYELEWALQSTCGVSRDSVKIEFVQNVYSSNIVFIDSTDQVLSDSIELANGTLRVVFSDSTIAPNDSSNLLFLTTTGLNLKANSVVVYGDTFEIAVQQGTVDDILLEGVISFAPINHQNSTVQRGQKKLPTREALLNGEYQSGDVLYSNIETTGPFELLGLRKRNTDDFSLDLTFNSTLYEDNSLKITAKGSINFVPNIVAELDFSLFSGLDSLRFGLDNARLTEQLEIKTDVFAKVDLKNYDPIKLYRQEALVLAGGVPIWTTTDVYLRPVIKTEASGQISLTFKETSVRSVDSYITYSSKSGKFEEHLNFNPPKRTTETTLSGNASLSNDFKVGPGLSLRLWKIAVGYVDVFPLKWHPEACIGLTGDWKIENKVSSEIELGMYGELFKGKRFFDKNVAFTPGGWLNQQKPRELRIYQGNFQNGTGGQMLATPIGVQVRNKVGLFSIPMPVKVYFDPVHGSVSQNSVFTDTNGIAEIDWTLDSGVAEQELKAYIQDCDKTILDGPIIFTAYTNANCEQTTLNASLDIDIQQGTITPIGLFGVPPYQYSTDGITYSSQAPSNPLTIGQQYTYYVKDQDACVKQRSYTHINNNPLIAVSYADKIVADQNVPVGFFDLSAGDPTNWLWDFGDGNISTLQNPTHQYSNYGTYDISLIISNTTGADSLVRTNYINIRPPGSPPLIPNTPTPSNGAQFVSALTSLSWSCSDPDGDSLTYDIYFDTIATPSILVNGHSSSNFSPANLKGGTTYYWRVVADDGNGNTTSSPTWSFQTAIYCNSAPTAVVDITNPTTGDTWMDRNLGASRAALDPQYDTLAIGDHYQWGRGPDGHQCRNSPTTSTLSTTDQPGHGEFIYNTSSNDWRSPQNTNLWQGVNGTNNPCPSGYRIPTIAEWASERDTWDSNTNLRSSTIKLVYPGERNLNSPSGYQLWGSYWSSTVNGLDTYVLYATFSAVPGMIRSENRSKGFAVRCIKD